MGFMRPDLTANVKSHAPSSAVERTVSAQQTEIDSNAIASVQYDSTALNGTARLIAAGEERLPNDLPPHVRDYLIDAVRNVRRQELINFIARQLAIAIQRRRDETK